MKIGIDIGGSHISSGIVNKNGKIIAKETRDIDVSNIKSGKKVEKIVIDIIDDEIQQLLSDNDYTIEDITKIGLAIPGSLKNNVIQKLVNLHIKNFDIITILENKYKINVKAKNDGKCAGIAEKKYGALREYDDCVFLCIGTGVGSAVFLDSDLLETKLPGGFELGHTVIQKDGTKCNCGRKGCFETFASMKRFKISAINEFKMPEDIESEEIQKYIRENLNKPKVKKFVNEYLENVNIGLCNIILTFKPEAICFGGSFSYYADIFLPILQKMIKKELAIDDDEIKLVPALLKNDAGIIGATEI